jgi:hypothetical protein
MDVAAFPLAWPAHVPRTKRRKGDAFKRRTQSEARDGLLDELVRLGATHIVISTDVHVRPDGRNIYANERASDPGVAAYFRRRGKSHVMALDVYTTLAANLWALAKTIESMRQIERHGSAEMLDLAFRGFAELPPLPEEQHWSTVLGVLPSASLDEIERAYRKQLPLVHPDRGGTMESTVLLNAAREAARRERS